MSVLIKGMKMPEHCGYCRFRYDGICHALQKTQYVATDCPLIDVPDHGDLLGTIPSAEPKWIPVTDDLPKEFTPVNVTWVNHSPESYYADIKDKPFTATAIYYDGEWWWYSSRCEDYLKEYGVSDMDYVADGIEITAWMPLPEPYEYPPKDFMNPPEGSEE